MRRLLATLLLALSGVVLTQLPAQACSCVGGGLQAHVKGASTVFTGTVTDKQAGGRTLTYTVAVERVFKGSAPAEATLRTAAQKSACGLDTLVADRRYVVFGTKQGDVIEVNSCGGTAQATTALVTRVSGLLGAGSSPIPTKPDEPTTATFHRVDETTTASLSRLAAPGAALVIVGLLGLAFLRRLNRRR